MPESKKTTKVAPKAAPKKTVEKPSGLSVGVFSLDGKSAGQLSLPKEIFGVEVNNSLLAQAMRVYMVNAQAHHGHTKTRGEVNLTTAKWFRQKGTGRARHGAQSAPIFVGGGVAMGPRKRKVILDLPERMKKAALISALSLRMKEGEIGALTGLDKATGKTKEMASLIEKIPNLKRQGTKNVLVVSDKVDRVARAVKNLEGVNLLTAEQLNVYQVISHQSLVVTKEAVEKLSERLKKND